MKQIKQDKYETLEVDNREKDMVMIWGIHKRPGKKTKTQVIHVERVKVDKLFEIIGRDNKERFEANKKKAK